MKHIVLGTAGHVDHGKTALIRALTGVDTDRLKEEKERGITIELGFASLRLGSGRIFGVVDVPGHERFVKNMVAGAAGIDLVLMVIAADEGVMPQTREHLQICSLLNIRKGLVALTKIDLVDRDWLELIQEDLADFLKGSFLEGAPVIPVSAQTGEGLPELLAALETVAAGIEEEPDSGVFRLPVDRVFTIRGFGTVVTGTLRSGQVSVADTVQMLPGTVTAKVRGLQVHNAAVVTAEAGQRTAVNLQGLEKADILRGQVLVHPDTMRPTVRVDTFLEYLPPDKKKLAHRSLVRLHTGTSETMARVLLMDQEELQPGERAYAQFFTSEPVVTMAGDHFVIRSYSPITTLGGGLIVDPLPRKHKRNDPAVLESFEQLHHGSDEEKTGAIIERSGPEGVALAPLVMRTGIPATRLRKILDHLLSRHELVLLDKDNLTVVSVSFHSQLQKKILQELSAYHKKYPLKEGSLKEELRSVLGRHVPVRLYLSAVQALEKAGKIVLDREIIRLADHTIQLKEDLAELREALDRLYLKAGLTPPTMREVMEQFAAKKDSARKVMDVMLRDGVLVKISEDLYFHQESLNKLRENYKKLLLKEGKATPASFRELTGLSRKFIIPLMEYFDLTRLTIRAGEHRLLREK
ncbi:MAG: selenocysteine-specific translation elongation factor [Syntrophus sp. (in: bacteria)]|nr:selenocysteine-specific translation elongation factor [Syntrophus sp. (in: bacteria)]